MKHKVNEVKQINGGLGQNELPTRGFSVHCSTQLSYQAKRFQKSEYTRMS